MNKEIVNECSVISSEPSLDFIFQACVAEFGLYLRNSEYASPNVSNVLERLDKDEFKQDVYKNEFAELVYKYINLFQ